MCMCVNGWVVCIGVHVTEHMRRSQDNFEELVLSFRLVLLPVPWSWPGSFWVNTPPPPPSATTFLAAGILELQPELVFSRFIPTWKRKI